MVIFGKYVCCSVVFGTLGDVSVFIVIWSELLVTLLYLKTLCKEKKYIMNLAKTNK